MSIPKRHFQDLVEVNGRVAPAPNARYKPSMGFTARITPKNNNITPWDNNTPIDFPVSQFDIDLVDEWYLRFGVTFDPNVPAALLPFLVQWQLLLHPAQFFIRQIDMYVGTECVESIKNFSLWQDKMQFTTLSESYVEGQYQGYGTYADPAQYGNIYANGNNTAFEDAGPYQGSFPFIGVNVGACSVGTGTGAGNVPSFTRNFVINFRTMIDKCRHNWRFICEKNNIFFRVIFNDKSATYVANQDLSFYNYDDGGGLATAPITNPNLTLNFLEMYARGVQLTTNERQRQDELYLSKGTALTSTALRTLVVPITQTLDVGQSTELVLTGVDGTITQLVAYIATAPELITEMLVTGNNGTSALIVPFDSVLRFASGAGVTSIIPSPVTLINRDGSPVWTSDIPIEIATLSSVREYENCPFQTGLIAYNFSADPKKTLEDGEVSGGVFFANWRLKFTSSYKIRTSSGVPNPNLYISCYQLCQIQTEPGTGKLFIRKV